MGAALRHVVRSEGLRALWKGNGVTIVHRLPYSAANFWMYEHVNEQWKRRFPAAGPLAAGDVARRLVAGGVAGMTACALVGGPRGWQGMRLGSALLGRRGDAL